MAFLAWHLGNGDSFICNAIVRHLAAHNDHLEVPCYPQNHDTVTWQFSDLKNVTVTSMFEPTMVERAATEESVKLGYYGESFNVDRFSESFYWQAGVPFTERWSSFHARRGDKQLVKYGNYIVVHDDAARGFPIAPYRLPDLPIVRLEGRSNMLDYLTLLENAVEIHCINSSLLCLCDSIDLAAKKFLHYYARPTVFPVLGRLWQILT